MPEMKTCRKCGEEYPATAEYFYRRVDNGKEKLKSTCKKCSIASDLERYYANKDNINQKRREAYSSEADARRKKSREHYHNGGGKLAKKAYYQENIDEIKVRKAEFRKNNRLKIRKAMLDYYHNRGGKVKHKEYRENNTEKIRESYNKYYRQNGHTTILAIVQRRQARKNDLPSDLSPEQWEEILVKFNYQCAYCGYGEKITQDHIVPLSKGGGYVKNNIVPACKSCNSSKHNRKMEAWYKTQPFYDEHRLAKISEHMQTVRQVASND